MTRSTGEDASDLLNDALGFELDPGRAYAAKLVSARRLQRQHVPDETIELALDFTLKPEHRRAPDPADIYDRAIELALGTDDESYRSKMPAVGRMREDGCSDEFIEEALAIKLKPEHRQAAAAEADEPLRVPLWARQDEEAYQLKLPAVRRMQARGFPDDFVEEVVGIRLKPEDRQPGGRT